jgi:hypothetical protein
MKKPGWLSRPMVLLFSGFLFWGCGDDSEPDAFSTSLHATARGMKTLYEQGFGLHSGVDYEDLACKNCHAAFRDILPRACDSCHLNGSEREEQTCLGCHGRQNKMRTATNYTDVHRSAGKKCMDCHTRREMHGDGNSYASMLAKGAMDTRCENCHESVSESNAHTVHNGKLHCTACHVRSVVTCYNCHFDKMVNSGEKKAYGILHDWVFLVNRFNQVRVANFQSIEYQGTTYLNWAPYGAHSVQKTGRGCGECHDNASVRQLENGSKIKVTWWDDGLQKASGVIPVVQGKMDLVFLNFDGKKWSPVSTQNLMETFSYCSGLTAQQIENLKDAKK